MDPKNNKIVWFFDKTPEEKAHFENVVSKLPKTKSLDSIQVSNILELIKNIKNDEVCF